MTFEHLVGNHYLQAAEFITVPNKGEDAIVFILDGIPLIAQCDPRDGYRSCCSDICIYNGKIHNRLPSPVPVTCTICNHFEIDESGEAVYSNQPDGDDEIFVVTDNISGRAVLAVGTLDYDDWYPCFYHAWCPDNLYFNCCDDPFSDEIQSELHSGFMSVLTNNGGFVS